MRLFISFLIILLIPINFISCNKLKTEDKISLKKTIVVLCDLSESTRSLRNVYLDSFKKVISQIKHGDVIVTAKITDASITEPEIPIKEVFSEFVALDKMGRPTDNPILVEQDRKEADEKLERKKEELVKTAKDTLFAGGGEYKKILRTDIMSSLHVAERIFKNYHCDKSILVVLSDMIEDSSEYNFEKENLTDRQIEEIIIKREKTKNRIPDLKDVEVYVVAAGAGGSKRFFAIQSFWLRYFKECGANLSKENYGSALINFNE